VSKSGFRPQIEIGAAEPNIGRIEGPDYGTFGVVMPISFWILFSACVIVWASLSPSLAERWEFRARRTAFERLCDQLLPCAHGLAIPPPGGMRFSFLLRVFRGRQVSNP
jgi:hypothetical protein